jgi:hypothetical protein
MTVPYTFANRTGNIPLSELDANFSNVSAFASTAGTVTTAAQPNISSVGTLSSLTVSGAGSMTGLTVNGAGSMASLTVSGNVTAGNLIGTLIGNISNAVYANTAGTVTTNAQPNITSVGTLTTLAVTGNITGGNVSTAGAVTVLGNITSGNVNTTGLIFSVGNISGGNVESTGTVRGLTVQANGNLVGGNANISTSVNSQSVNTQSINAANVSAGNISAIQITTTGNISSSGNISGNYFIGNGSQLTGLGGPVFMATQTSYQNLASSPSSISSLSLIYDNVTLNISNGYSSTTGIFTAPESGVYQVNGSIGINPAANLNASGAGALVMYYNGNTYAAGPFIQAFQAITGNALTTVISQSSLSTLVYLNTNDTVQLKLGYYTNVASNVWTTETNLVPSSFQAAWIRS